ncbi:MAG: glycosyl hydrolase 53 family protein [Ruminococcus sp.]|nr:glycosyl hydrolase 53 family protein [Ruminococcus sp.]
MSKYQIGMDISTLYDLEEEGIKLYDNGKEGDLIAILGSYGVNSVRLRLWHNPFDENGETYGAGTCDLKRVTSLAKRVKAAGMSFLLDIHYSDFWCDPSKQTLPKAWKSLSFEELKTAVHDYTVEVIEHLKANGCEPDMVQVGNEITGGMLWEYGRLTWNEEKGCHEGYDNLCELLKAGVSGVRSTTSAKVVIHLERSFDNPRYREFFDNLVSHDVDFDAIGFSYYPYWHHGFDELVANMNDMAERYGKELYIAETSYAFTLEHFDKSGVGQHLVVDHSYVPEDGQPLPYPISIEGQRQFIHKLLELMESVKNFKGIYYWEPAWIPSPKGTWASEGARKYIHEENKTDGNEWANQCLFDYEGNALPALNEFKSFADRNN